MTPNKKKAAAGFGTRAASNTALDSRNPTQPLVTGQSAQVLSLIRQHQPLLSLVLTADHAIPEAAARVHDLRAKGYNIQTQIIPEVRFRGAIRRKVAMYSLGTPEWPAPGLFDRDRGEDA